MSAVTSNINWLKTHGARLVIRLLFWGMAFLLAKEAVSEWTLFEQFTADPQAFLTGYQARLGITEGFIRGTFYLYFGISAAVCAGLLFPAEKWWALWQGLVLIILQTVTYDWLHIQLDAFYRVGADAVTNMTQARASYFGELCFLLLAGAIVYIRPPRRKYYFWGVLAFLLLRAAAYFLGVSF